MSERMGMLAGQGPAADLFARSAEYDAMLAQGLALAGEDKPYFIGGRLDRLFALLPAGFRPRRILDFGCGIGDTAAHLVARSPGAEVVGVDPSGPAIELAASRHPQARFASVDDLPSLGAFDLAYVNGVLHHVASAQRPAALAALHGCLAAGGYLALFENNAWNPGAWLVMRRIPFDRGCSPMSPARLCRLVRAAGFGGALRVRSLFYFPRALAALRPLEPALGTLPFGAQVLVLATRR